MASPSTTLGTSRAPSWRDTPRPRWPAGQSARGLMDTERQDNVGQPFSHLLPLEHGRGSCRPRPGVPALLLTLGIFEQRLRDCSGPCLPLPLPFGTFSPEQTEGRLCSVGHLLHPRAALSLSGPQFPRPVSEMICKAPSFARCVFSVTNTLQSVSASAGVQSLPHQGPSKLGSILSS